MKRMLKGMPEPMGVIQFVKGNTNTKYMGGEDVKKIPKGMVQKIT